MRKILWVIPCAALCVVFASSLSAAQPDLAAADEAISPAETMAQAEGQPAPHKSPAQIPTISESDAEAEYPELAKAKHKAEAAIAANAWVLKVPHVKGMMPWFILEKNAPAGTKGVGETGIRVWVDQAENVREVEGQVPSQLSGVPVVVEANPTDLIAP